MGPLAAEDPLELKMDLLPLVGDGQALLLEIRGGSPAGDLEGRIRAGGCDSPGPLLLALAPVALSGGTGSSMTAFPPSSREETGPAAVWFEHEDFASERCALVPDFPSGWIRIP